VVWSDAASASRCIFTARWRYSCVLGILPAKPWRLL
jgi:hypothetical protein